jgi:hypothetical protein
LGKRHGTILLAAAKRPYPNVAAVPRGDSSKTAPRQKIHKLSKQRLAGVHWPSPRKSSEKCKNQFKSTPGNFAWNAAENKTFLGNRFKLSG